MSTASRGFVALLSVLMVSSILLAASLSASEAAAFAQRAVADEFSYRAAIEAARSCATLAVSRLSADPHRFERTGTTTIILSPDASHPISCSISSAHGTSLDAHAMVQGYAGDSFVQFHARALRASASSPFQMTFERI